MPLTPTTRLIVQIVHFLVFFVCGWQIWVYVERVEALKRRIWSPYLLLLGFIVRSLCNDVTIRVLMVSPSPHTPKFTRVQWLQVGSAIEIANHHYEGNFELKEFKTDLVNGIFCTSFRILHLPTNTDGAATSRQISSTLEHSFLWRSACAIQTIAQRFLGSTMVRRIGAVRHLSSY